MKPKLRQDQTDREFVQRHSRFDTIMDGVFETLGNKESLVNIVQSPITLTQEKVEF